MQNEITHSAFYAQDSRPIWKCLLSKLFPSRWIGSVQDGEYITNETTCYLDFTDRLRVLVSGKVRVYLEIKTEGPVLCLNSQSVVYILPPFHKD